MKNELAVAERRRSISVVEAPLGAGALDPGCRDGPAAFRSSGEPAFLHADGVALHWREAPNGNGARPASRLDAIAEMTRWLAGTVAPLAAEREHFAVLGGDHSCAVGTWSGAARAVRAEGGLGLVWIDAHLDLHRPQSSHSGAINGMPVACLLGHGYGRLTGLAGGAPALAPANVCLVGVRSFEPEEAAFAEAYGIRVIDMAEVNERGLDAALDEACAIAGAGTRAYGVSLDLDAIDPRDAPGVGTPEPHGIAAKALLASWRNIVSAPRCLGIEIAEFNPHRDIDSRTVRLIGSLIGLAFGTDNQEKHHDRSG